MNRRFNLHTHLINGAGHFGGLLDDFHAVLAGQHGQFIVV